MKDVPVRRIDIGKNVSEPVRLSLKGAENRVEIHLAHGIKATVFDTSTSKRHTVHIVLEPESALEYVSLSTDSVRRLTADIGSGATVHWHCTTLGTAEEPHTLVSTLNGRDAKSDIDWIFAVAGKEHQDVSARNVFGAENGGGEITLRGIAEGTASASCDGMIEITEQGKGTVTYLTEDVLMLDPTAKIDAIPGLEIRTNDVKASHSATVSRVTEEDLFYFRSRGIDAESARSMYVDGFLRSLLDRIAEPSVREEIAAATLRTGSLLS